MALSAGDYFAMLQSLFPLGPAFPRDDDTYLNRVLGGLAVELARVDQRLDDLINESDPRTANETIADWEKQTGMPDNCSGTLAPTLQGRRNAVAAKLASVGGQTKAYLIDVAASLGYTITIDESVLVSGTQINGAFRVNSSTAANVINFRVGQSRVGERLRQWGNADLECKINQLKPAHLTAYFSYT